MRFLIYCFATILTVCIATSCTDRTIYYSYISTPTEGWDVDDTLVYHIFLKEPQLLIYLETEVRSSNTYPYRDLWLELSHTLKDSTNWQVDTLQFTLADEEGTRKDQSWSCFYQKSKSLAPIFIKGTGNYVVKVKHIMRDKQLQGIHDIGIHIKK